MIWKKRWHRYQICHITQHLWTIRSSRTEAQKQITHIGMRMAVWHTALQLTKYVGIIHILRSNTNSPWKWSPFNQVDPVCLKVPLPQTFAGPETEREVSQQKHLPKTCQFFGKQQFLLPLPGACPWQETWWLFPRLPWRFPQMDYLTSIGQTFCWKGQACQPMFHHFPVPCPGQSPQVPLNLLEKRDNATMPLATPLKHRQCLA